MSSFRNLVLLIVVLVFALKSEKSLGQYSIEIGTTYGKYCMYDLWKHQNRYPYGEETVAPDKGFEGSFAYRIAANYTKNKSTFGLVFSKTTPTARTVSTTATTYDTDQTTYEIENSEIGLQYTYQPFEFGRVQIFFSSLAGINFGSFKRSRIAENANQDVLQNRYQENFNSYFIEFGPGIKYDICDRMYLKLMPSYSGYIVKGSIATENGPNDPIKPDWSGFRFEGRLGFSF